MVGDIAGFEDLGEEDPVAGAVAVLFGYDWVLKFFGLAATEWVTSGSEIGSCWWWRWKEWCNVIIRISVDSVVVRISVDSVIVRITIDSVIHSVVVRVTINSIIHSVVVRVTINSIIVRITVNSIIIRIAVSPVVIRVTVGSIIISPINSN